MPLATAATKHTIQISIQKIPHFREQSLYWAHQNFNTCCYLTSNGYVHNNFSQLNGVLAIGVVEELSISLTDNEKEPFEQLQQAWEQSPGWWFGGLAYDLKNATEKLTSQHPDHLEFPDLYFFKPQHIIHFSESAVRIESTTMDEAELIDRIQKTKLPTNRQLLKTKFQSRFTKSEYLQTVDKIRAHILAGDIYEMNFCQEFYSENYFLEDPLLLFRKLNEQSSAPFAGFFKWSDRYLCCASPERFIQKRGNRLISQPIKGTAARLADPAKDEQQKLALYHSKKDRSENVMIVDLVRNDLARSCQPGTVRVEELFGIYSFPQVHQMISTITGELRSEVSFSSALRNAFPMGSMTGAPKISSMQLIERYERSKRGWYSGAIGYLTPEGDFDFNVVIRSIQYHAKKQYLSYQVGGAIVYDSIPEKEYEECLVKAKGILETIT